MLKRNKRPAPRIFFATDVHGSETCFRKFVNAAEAYSADAIILGGDITGKQLVVIVADNGGWRIGRVHDARASTARRRSTRRSSQLSAGGLYPIVVTPEEERALADDPAAVEERFTTERLERVRTWMQLAEERLRPQGIPCFVSPGNDDDREVAQVIDELVGRTPEGDVVEVSGHEMISWGWSNHTPWDTPREQSEAELGGGPRRDGISAPGSRGGDLQPALPAVPIRARRRAGARRDPEADHRAAASELQPVGSTAVRDAIELYQPLVGLHGHIHDCRAMKAIGRSMCINPGSDYQTATLRGAIVVLAPHESDGMELYDRVSVLHDASARAPEPDRVSNAEPCGRGMTDPWRWPSPRPSRDHGRGPTRRRRSGRPGRAVADHG